MVWNINYLFVLNSSFPYDNCILPVSFLCRYTILYYSSNTLACMNRVVERVTNYTLLDVTLPSNSVVHTTRSNTFIVTWDISKSATFLITKDNRNYK